MQKQNFSKGGFMPKNRQYYRKTKYPDKVAKPKSLVFVRIFLFSSVGSRNAYFPTAPAYYEGKALPMHGPLKWFLETYRKFRLTRAESAFSIDYLRYQTKSHEKDLIVLLYYLYRF